MQAKMQPERQRLRLNAATIALLNEDGHGTVIFVPAGDSITVLGDLNETTQPNRLVVVQWQEKKIKMFAVDLLERGKPV